MDPLPRRRAERRIRRATQGRRAAGHAAPVPVPQRRPLEARRGRRRAGRLHEGIRPARRLRRRQGRRRPSEDGRRLVLSELAVGRRVTTRLRRHPILRHPRAGR
ncbi:protein of unknown function [Burkholderia multivorans]